MVNVPFRDLAAKGILRDPAPYQLDLDAWSRGSNVRFHGNGAERSPIFRTVQDTLTDTPAFGITYRPPAGFDTIYFVGAMGQVYSYANSSVGPVTMPSGWTGVASSQAWTGQFLADVLYLNNPSGVPVCLLPGGSTPAFTYLTGWDSTWRCRSLRAFGDYAIALNVTKGTTSYPAMVKWSDLTLAGQCPGSWNQNDPTTSAGENILEGLDTPIIDGAPMQNGLMIYSSNQVWAMSPSGNYEIFTFTRVFGEGGILAPTCVAERDGKHYVFGSDDLYVHDGITKLSLVDKRNKDAIFRNLNRVNSDLAFVQWMPRNGEVLFAYPSSDPDAAFPQSSLGCNRGFVYSIETDTGTFVDLPNVTAATLASVSNALTYADAAPTVTFSTVGGSYADQTSGLDRVPVFTSIAQSGRLTSSRILAYDFFARGSVASPYCAEASPPPLLERTGIDLDQLGSDLGTAKQIRRLFPQIVLYGIETSISISVGSSMTPAGPINWAGPYSFDPVTQYKVDFRRGGRYLALRFQAAADVDFALVGYDADITPAGAR